MRRDPRDYHEESQMTNQDFAREIKHFQSFPNDLHYSESSSYLIVWYILVVNDIALSSSSKLPQPAPTTSKTSSISNSSNCFWSASMLDYSVSEGFDCLLTFDKKSIQFTKSRIKYDTTVKKRHATDTIISFHFI